MTNRINPLVCPNNYLVCANLFCTAFWLADQGYDVFLGNFRGSRYSRTHTKYKINSSKFWNFTYDDRYFDIYKFFFCRIDTLAENDLLVMLNAVANANKSNKKIIYIGHSMGTTSVFMLASRFPYEIQNLLEVIIAFSPIVYLQGVLPILTTIGMPLFVSPL